jgi:hypothetical protein
MAEATEGKDDDLYAALRRVKDHLRRVRDFGEGRSSDFERLVEEAIAATKLNEAASAVVPERGLIDRIFRRRSRVGAT